jgi:predicted TIM-barrel fold metal-dependent hydrolase
MPTSFSILRASLRLPCPALDWHVHPPSCFASRPPTAAEDLAGLREPARRAGVEKVCLFSVAPGCPPEPRPEECRQANDHVLRLRDLDPGFVLPFCYVTPAHPQESAREVERCVAGEQMVGVKLWIARKASDPGLDPILVQAIALGVPVLQHAWRKTTGNLPHESEPADVADLAQRHPAARIAMAHLNGCNPRGVEEVAGCGNVLVDTAGGDPENGMVELAVARLGRHRVLFGSDAPIRHFAVSLAKVLAADVPEPVRQDILWGNAARILPPWAGVSPR